MKKLLISFIIIILIALAIPLVGNKVIESTLENRIEVLTSYGLKVKDSKTDSAYLSTKKHFIFKVEDKDKFISYLNQFSDTQLPPYIDALVDGAEVGLDVKYSNIPINDSVSIDIYPNALPTQIQKDLKSEDAKFFTYIDALLKNKAINYHLNYDVLNEDFDGYIDDIDEKQTMSDGSLLSLKLYGATFKGTGMIIAPDTLALNIKELKASIKTKEENMDIDLAGFISSSVFESRTTYATTMKFNKIKWKLKNLQDADMDIYLENLALDFSSNTQSVKADFYTKMSFDNMDIKTADSKISTVKFNYDIALRGVSKDSYEKLVELINKAKLDSSQELQDEIEDATYELLGRGMVLDIADLSIENLSTKKTKNLGGMSLKSKIIFKQDRDLAKKIKTNHMAVLDNADMGLLFTMSKNMYPKLSIISPLFGMIKGFSKDDEDNIIFEIKLEDSKLSVNGRGI